MPLEKRKKKKKKREKFASSDANIILKESFQTIQLNSKKFTKWPRNQTCCENNPFSEFVSNKKSTKRSLYSWFLGSKLSKPINMNII